jgi:TrmH RNA methyltransferase
MSTDDKRPRGDKKPFGKKPYRSGGGFGDKKPYGDKKPFGDKKRFAGPGAGPRGPRPEGDRPFRDRGPRPDGPSRPRPFGDRPDRDRGPRRDFGDKGRPRGPRPVGEGPSRPRPFGDRPDRDRGPRPVGDRQFRERGPRADGERPSRPFGNRPDREERAPRKDRPFRGMYGGPKKDGEYPRGDRPFRRGPARGADQESSAPRVRSPEDTERRHLGEDELRYLGKNACLGLFKARPDDIVRVYVLRSLAEEFAAVIEYCGKNHLSYHLVEEQDLERLTDSVHHQGICIVARMKRFFPEEAFFRELGAHRTLVLYLDGVANPHNLGAIVRTAAHFGVKFVCVPKDEINKLSPALYRTAEGGAEAVNVVRIEEPEKFFDRLSHQGFHLYAFEAGKKSMSLFDTRLNEKSVFVFGAEVEGLSGLVKSVVESKIKIPGTGEVESLNVSVAAAVAMAEFEKQGVTRSVRIVKKKS